MQLIFLIGMPASGKTSLGRQLSKKLGYAFLDLDKELVKSAQQSIKDIFSVRGEAGFRLLEKRTLETLVFSCEEPTILATGGGTPCFHDNMKLMNEAGSTIYIDTPVSLLAERLVLSHKRPLIHSEKVEQQVEELFLIRKTYYEQANFILSNPSNQLEDALTYILKR